MSGTTTGGTGSGLPTWVLALATVCAGFATCSSLLSIYLQLRNYRKVALQRWVTRILLMVPIYSISSAVSLYSLDAAFFIDVIRDIYEAFVIYCFFCLLVEYLGGERSLIIMLHGRPPTRHPWPLSSCLPPLDASDPYSFLALKRGVLAYVSVKPVLALATVVTKALGVYGDGNLSGRNGYTYISIVYNFSVSLSLYCLALFWVSTHDDLKPFRPTPKFLCVKGIVFLTFWQGFLISILVKSGQLSSDLISTEHLSVAVQDALICFEMPLFAIMHLYAFDHRDYIDIDNQYAGRLPFFYALRDSLFGFRDVFGDSLTTLRGSGISYKTFEPVEGGIHQGIGRDRRIRAGLRYIDGGKRKTWLPMPGAQVSDAFGRQPDRSDDRQHAYDILRQPVTQVKRLIEEHRFAGQGYAPLSPEQAEQVVHDVERGEGSSGSRRWQESMAAEDYEYDGQSDTSSLSFSDPDEEEDAAYTDSRRLEWGDPNCPVVDASKEQARREMRAAEDALLYDRGARTRSLARRMKESAADATRSSGKGKAPALSTPGSRRSVGLVDSVTHKLGINETPDEVVEHKLQKHAEQAHALESDLPDGCVDILVEDEAAEDEVAMRERLRGDPNRLGGTLPKVYRRVGGPKGEGPGAASEVPAEASAAEQTKRKAAIETVINHDRVKISRQVSEPQVAQVAGFTPDHVRDPTAGEEDGDPWRHH